MIKRLSDDQDEVWIVMLEQLKSEIFQQGQTPTEAFERFKDFCRFLEVVCGSTSIPTDAKQLAFYFQVFTNS